MFESSPSFFVSSWETDSRDGFPGFFMDGFNFDPSQLIYHNPVSFRCKTLAGEGKRRLKSLVQDKNMREGDY